MHFMLQSDADHEVCNRRFAHARSDIPQLACPDTVPVVTYVRRFINFIGILTEATDP
jgi:hypothetical protein